MAGLGRRQSLAGCSRGILILSPRDISRNEKFGWQKFCSSLNFICSCLGSSSTETPACVILSDILSKMCSWTNIGTFCHFLRINFFCRFLSPVFEGEGERRWCDLMSSWQDASKTICWLLSLVITTGIANPCTNFAKKLRSSATQVGLQMSGLQATWEGRV